MGYEKRALQRPAKGSIFWGAVTMFIGSFVLGWIPFIGPFIAGLIGGKITGSSGRGVTAALIPTAIAAIVVILLAIFHGPLALVGGLFIGVGVVIFGILHGLALLLGAVIGGAL